MNISIIIYSSITIYSSIIKFVATFYDNNSFKAEYSGSNDNNINEYNKTDLKWNGDFRSNECIQILNKCDIIYIII